MFLNEFEKKRARNQLWNGAQDYTVEPVFLMYDNDGISDIYMNSVIGSAHLCFDFGRCMEFYRSIRERAKDPDQQYTLETLYWLAMEDAVFEIESRIRPPFVSLRRSFAKQKLRAMPALVNNTADRIFRAYLYEILGQRVPFEDALSREEEGLLFSLTSRVSGEEKLFVEKTARGAGGAVRFGTDREANTEIFLDMISTAFAPYMRDARDPDDAGELCLPEALRKFFSFFGSSRKFGRPPKDVEPVRHLAHGLGEHFYEYTNKKIDQHQARAFYGDDLVQTEEYVRDYIEAYFGKSIYGEYEKEALDRELLTGNHEDARIHITRGEHANLSVARAHMEKIRRRASEQQRENNSFYESRSDVYELVIHKLTMRIRNSLLMSLDDDLVTADTGKIIPNRIYRALYLNEGRIFSKELKGNPGNISVDILLDASDSQIVRSKIVSAQGYIIAESLTRCGIPVRVSSFCSMKGYTVLRIYRDYNEEDKNREIFEYRNAGANRDGLAMRIMGSFMKENSSENRILIVLTDCKPNDVIKIRRLDGGYDDYTADVGVDDTASEVRRMRHDGVRVISVFTGNDEDLASVRRIYGTSFVRISSFDMFAEAVASLLQNEIRLMGT